MKWLNYHHLYYFREIAKEGSISKASEKLLVGQPALSTQLKQLEQSLGASLFKRLSRSLELTEAGRLALEYADEIFDKGDEFLNAFESKKFSKQCRFKVGATGAVPKNIVADAIGMVKALHPECFVSIYEEDRERLMQRLSSKEIDFAITDSFGSENSNLYKKCIQRVPVHLYGSSKFKDLKAKLITGNKEFPVILQTIQSDLRWKIEQYLLEQGIQVRIVSECQDYSVKIELAKRGMGLVFLPEDSASELVDKKELELIHETEDVFEEYWVVAPRAFASNDIATRLGRLNH